MAGELLLRALVVPVRVHVHRIRLPVARALARLPAAIDDRRRHVRHGEVHHVLALAARRKVVHEPVSEKGEDERMREATE